MQLKLSVKQIKELQKKHGIANLLQPGTEDAAKLVNVEFLTDFYYEGSRKFETPPTRESIDEMEVAELIEGFQGFFKQGSEGNA